MNTLLHFLLQLCQSCHCLRSVSFGGRILGLIKVLITVGWVWWRHQRAPLFSLASGPPNLKPTTGRLHKFLDDFYYLDIWQCARYFVAALFKELALITIRNVRSRVSVSNFQVSVLVPAFMTKSRSRSLLEIWARSPSRSRRLWSRLHHWSADNMRCDLAKLVWLFHSIFQEFLSHYVVNVEQSTLCCVVVDCIA